MTFAEPLFTHSKVIPNLGVGTLPYFLKKGC